MIPWGRGPSIYLLNPRAFHFPHFYRPYGSRLAERIVSFLPGIDDSSFEQPLEPVAQLDSVPSLLGSCEYFEATQQVLNSSSIESLESDLKTQLLDRLSSPFGKKEVSYSLYKLGLGHLVQDAKTVEEIKVLDVLKKSTYGVLVWDQLLQNTVGQKYPQIFWSERWSSWLKIRAFKLALERESIENAEVMIQRHARHFKAYDSAVHLLKNLEPQRYDLIIQVLLKSGQSPEIFAVIDSCDKQSFKRVSTRIQATAKRAAVDDGVIDSLLRKAIEYGLSYEIAQVCKFASQNGYTLSNNVRARALLAVAWAQKKHGDDFSLTTASHINTTLVSKVLKSIDEPSLQRVMYFTVTRGALPPNILWTLLLSWNELNLGPFSKPIGHRIVQLIAERPHLEQFRFMSLASSNQFAITELLRHNIRSVNENRIAKNVGYNHLVEQADMRLLAGGMILMSESRAENRYFASSFGKVLQNLFAFWSQEQATQVLDTLSNHYKPDPQTLLIIVGILLKHKAYTQAVQLLHSQPSSSLPPKIFHQLLLQVCSDAPTISTILTTWLAKTVRVYIPSNILRQMIVNLSHQKILSDRQSIHRIHQILKLLRGQNASLGPEAAAAIVDGLLGRAFRRPGGSRRRLEWALDICKDQNVPESKVKKWVQVIDNMRKTKRGYWSGRFGN